MPRQTTGVQITDNGDGTANVQIGLFGYTVNVSDLFSSAYDEAQVRANCRLAFLLGNQVDPTTNEFLTDVNKTNQGMETGFGNIQILSVKQIDPNVPTFQVDFTIKSGPQKGQTFGFTMDLSEFTSDVQDQTVILKNLPAFMRKGGHASLTTAAINAVKAWSFRY